MRILAILLSFVVILSGCSVTVSNPSQHNNGYILIDPGHGGFDGGTVADNGTCEKHLNLAIALILRDMLAATGTKTIMTRDSDISLADEHADSIRSKKVSDMKRRLELYNQADTVISIHQNHFGSSQYKGTQVFYTPNHPDGKGLASCMQQTVKQLLQADNNREIKQASNGIYLLYHTTQPAVLVECGFLSNSEERTLLETADYQQQMAFALLVGYYDYFTQK